MSKTKAGTYKHLIGTEGGTERVQFGIWFPGVYLAVKIRGKFRRFVR